jgi:hypothetical protein
MVEKCEYNNAVIKPINIAIISCAIALLGTIMSVSAGWGRINEQQKTISTGLQTKLNKETFDVFMKKHEEQLNKIDERQQRLEDKVDRVLDVLSSKQTIK